MACTLSPHLFRHLEPNRRALTGLAPIWALLALALIPGWLLAQEVETVWRDARELVVEGQGWSSTAAPWDRLPATAEDVVRGPVWRLSRESAGIAVRFVSDTPSLQAHWTLTSPELAMTHMPATGVSGLDLYARTYEGWRWMACGRPGAQENSALLIKDLPPGTREYLLYLPLYNGVESLQIGIPPGFRLEPAAERPQELNAPLVFYGTSITQGACASRAGMVHTAILGRRFDRPVINLGFSGNGTLDLELADLLGELEAAVYILDCLPNLKADKVADRAGPFVRRLRALRPATPILLVEDRSYGNDVWRPSARLRNETSRAALRTAYDELVAEGIPGLAYLEGGSLLGDDGEATVDSSHPTDLGFVRQADAFEPAIAALLP